MSITVFSRATCAPCNQLKKFLDYKNVSYKVVDIDDNPEKIQGFTTVPHTVVEKDGETVEISGYNLPLISKAIL